jgi:mycofactocin precursor
MAPMNKPETAEAPPATAPRAAEDDADLVEFVEEDLLVEEISIDGMCGVY